MHKGPRRESEWNGLSESQELKGRGVEMAARGDVTTSREFQSVGPSRGNSKEPPKVSERKCQ